MTFWAYLLHCADGSYYCGQTDNLEGRIGQHMQGTIAGHTRNRRPVKLIWCQEFPSRIEALEAERRIKGWTRAKKEALIRGDWEALSLLARNRQNNGYPLTSSGRTALGDAASLPLTVRPEHVEACPERRRGGQPSINPGFQE